jgi:rare lipoprotein A (peptidoglycan hydrolase)
MNHSKMMRRVFVATLTVSLLVVAIMPAGAVPRPSRWWQYDMETWTNSWKSESSLVHSDNRWHRRNPEATDHDIHAYHSHLNDRFYGMHFHEASGVQRGSASWYSDRYGACGRLTGVTYYAASRTLPCGTKLSVRSGDRYVIVTILDRGPFTGGNRILDLSKAAFRRLSPLGAGVVNVTATRLRP